MAIRPRLNRRAAGISGLPINLSKDYVRRTIRRKKGLFGSKLGVPSIKSFPGRRRRS